MTSRDLTGMGYGRETKAEYIKELVEVAAKTPLGEYLRRYWHPVAISADLTDAPVRRRILCEDLVLFRDGSGRPGAVYESCIHRGASLFFGRVDSDGIRCCYHGWKFDVEGRCVNQPLETRGGNCAALRQPWYPVEELYGMVWVYMGPPDQMPLLPRYKGLEDLEDDEYYSVSFESMPGSTSENLPYTWLVNMDNIHDMGHALWLHHLHSGPQFGPAFFYATEDNAAHHQNKYQYVETPQGIYSDDDEIFFDGAIMKTRLETIMPNVRIICVPVKVGDAYNFNWCVPVDDGNHYNIGVARVKKGGIDMSISPMAHWDRSDPLVVQRAPSDFEAQLTQGPLPRHSEEHLVKSDRGVVKMRRQYLNQIKAMEKGERLMNIRFEGEDPFTPTHGGAWLVTPAPEGAPPPAMPEGMFSGASTDVAGDWSVTLVTPMGPQVMTCRFTQQAFHLFGTMTTPEGDVIELTNGAVHESRLVWQAQLTQPMTMDMAFDVTVDGDTLSGTFKPGAFPPGEITGRRV